MAKAKKTTAATDAALETTAAAAAALETTAAAAAIDTAAAAAAAKHETIVAMETAAAEYVAANDGKTVATAANYSASARLIAASIAASIAGQLETAKTALGMGGNESEKKYYARVKSLVAKAENIRRELRHGPLNCPKTKDGDLKEFLGLDSDEEPVSYKTLSATDLPKAVKLEGFPWKAVDDLCRKRAKARQETAESNAAKEQDAIIAAVCDHDWMKDNLPAFVGESVETIASEIAAGVIPADKAQALRDHGQQCLAAIASDAINAAAQEDVNRAILALENGMASLSPDQAARLAAIVTAAAA